MAAVGFELTTLGFIDIAPTHCAIGADPQTIDLAVILYRQVL